MHIQEDSSESSGGSTPTCASSSSYMEPGAIYVQRQPSGKPAFVRRPRRIKTPGGLLADALFNPHPVSQKHSPSQARDQKIFEPASSPEPQQIPAPLYEQFQQYPHPQQHPLQYPRQPFSPNVMAQIFDSCEDLSPEWARKIGQRVLVVAPSGSIDHCAARVFVKCCHSCDCRGRRRNSHRGGHRRHYGSTSEESDIDSSSESDIPVKKQSQKHKSKGKHRKKSPTKKNIKNIYDSSEEEGEKRRDFTKKPVRPVHPDANLVGSGRYDSRTGTVRFSNQADEPDFRRTNTADSSRYVNHSAYPIPHNPANGPGYYPASPPPPHPPDGNEAMPIYHPVPHPPAPEQVQQTSHDDSRRHYEYPSCAEVAEPRGRESRRRARPPPPPPRRSASHNRPRSFQYHRDDQRYLTREHVRGPRGVDEYDEYDMYYYYTSDTLDHPPRNHTRPSNPDQYARRRRREPPQERSYSRHRPAHNPAISRGGFDRRPVTEVREVRPVRRHDELDPPTRPRREN
ncbi:predicted protein [Histoplasma capsulatum var. duboisii H88]|uniref:Predicted protein n=2 Tax=Ajellomyces capsulatus (strain H88) TaxID=544711 RepID=F0UD19_AJEC8|nr:predicted protein [Histoplasma capsulatum var. duboisii H88]